MLHDAHHKDEEKKEPEAGQLSAIQQEQQQPEARQENQADNKPSVSADNKQLVMNEDDFWSIYFFYRRFIS